MKLVATFAALLTLAIPACAFHVIPAFRFPSKAWPVLLAALKDQEALKVKLAAEGKASCCIKPPRGSRVASCAMCLTQRGQCDCAANLLAGKGACGECKGAWVNGHGAFDLKDTGFATPADIPVLPVTPDPQFSDPLAKTLRERLNNAKRTLVGEGRFNCCVGRGGCDECAMEQYCGCGVNLAQDAASPPTAKKIGVCGQCLDGQHAGIGRIPGVDPQHVHVMADMHEMATGIIANQMQQVGSGTSWLPANSPMFMQSLPRVGDFDASLMGLATLNYADSGGKRGDSQTFATTMGMLMLQRAYESGGRLGLNLMVSLDALTNGKYGYPNLFQTGETAYGEPLTDRQHPHDLFMELSATYSHPLGPTARGFLYLAPVGEPALGTAAYQHRPSASELPEAPISHHWNDGTHITYGVVTGGVTFADHWKVDASVFNGREPDEDRYNFDRIQFNSYSGRITYNPSSQWSFSGSYGYLHEPESLEAGESQHRMVASAMYSAPLRGAARFDLTGYWARNVKSHGDTDAILAEATYANRNGSLFARWEHVEKDELVGVPAGTYQIDKFGIGGVRNLGQTGGWEYGIGGYVDFFAFPRALRPYYGDTPVSVGVFLRIRPKAMQP